MRSYHKTSASHPNPRLIPCQAALSLVADLMTGSAAGLREGVALLTRMHYSHSALPDTAFNVLPSSAQRCAAPLLANPTLPYPTLQL